jgi:hypothetical protein
LEHDGGHAVACHFWRELPVPEGLRSAAPDSAASLRLARLQSAFATHNAVA